jgi:large subunit ribosomal protein L7/L12
MAVSKSEILESISNLSVLELSELIKDMEEKFGVSAAAPAVAMAAPAGGAEAPVADAEKTEFDVVLSATNLGLKEAKDLVESAPTTVKEAVNKEEAEELKKQLEEVGATAELK